MGTKAKLEYIWLDGYQPTQSLRSKTKIVKNFSGKLDGLPDLGLRRLVDRAGTRADRPTVCSSPSPSIPTRTASATATW